jgi:hypothetical protein
MECKSCGGLVLWCGPLTGFTHTECQQCGAVNNQVLDPEHMAQDYEGATDHPEDNND